MSLWKLSLPGDTFTAFLGVGNGSRLWPFLLHPSIKLFPVVQKYCHCNEISADTIIKKGTFIGWKPMSEALGQCLNESRHCAIWGWRLNVFGLSLTLDRSQSKALWHSCHSPDASFDLAIFCRWHLDWSPSSSAQRSGLWCGVPLDKFVIACHM